MFYLTEGCDDGLFYSPVSNECVAECPLFYTGDTTTRNCTACKLILLQTPTVFLCHRGRKQGGEGEWSSP